MLRYSARYALFDLSYIADTGLASANKSKWTTTTLKKAYSINDYKVGNKVPKINKIYGKKAQRHTISIMVLT